MADNATTMTASVRHCYLPSLPSELRDMILALLTLKDVARLMKTCKAFEQVARANVWSECTTKGYKALAKMTAKRRKDHASKINSIKLEPERRKFPIGRIALPYLQNLEVKVQPRMNFKINSFLSSTLKTLVIHDLGHRNFLSSLHKATSLEVLRIRYKKCWGRLEPFPRLLTFPLLHTLDLDLQVPGQIFLDAAKHPNIQTLKLRCLLRRSDVEAVVKVPKLFVKLTSLDICIDLCVVETLLPRLRRLITLHLRVNHAQKGHSYQDSQHRSSPRSGEAYNPKNHIPNGQMGQARETWTQHARHERYVQDYGDVLASVGITSIPIYQNARCFSRYREQNLKIFSNTISFFINRLNNQTLPNITTLIHHQHVFRTSFPRPLKQLFFVLFWRA